ncbi:MAG TPA: hypothetical protein DCE71_00405, partial [Parachlamydiales bacterium]|nr:hypothetical protein [Parachlamydiales bacterium]
MKNLFFFLFLSFYSLGFASTLQQHQINPQALRELVAVLNIPDEADLIEETQKRWLRKPNQERWEMAELSLDQREFVLDWAAEQNILADMKPSEMLYDKALILGATTGHMQLRLNFLMQHCVEGVRFHEVVCLSGERPLDHKVDQLVERCN